MFDVAVGGTDKCTGGTAIGDSTFTNYAAAFDNTSGGWIHAGDAPGWIGYDFGSGVAHEIARLTWKATSFPQQAPSAFTVDYSDDGSSWTTVYTGAGADIATWSADEQRTFVTGLTGSGGAGTAARPVVFVCT